MIVMNSLKILDFDSSFKKRTLNTPETSIAASPPSERRKLRIMSFTEVRGFVGLADYVEVPSRDFICIHFLFVFREFVNPQHIYVSRHDIIIIK